MKIDNSVRGLVIHDGKLLVFRLRNCDFWSIPGGRIEPNGEDFHQSLERELIEEAGVKPVVGKLILIQQLFLGDTMIVEHFFEVKNSADFLNIDTTKTSHGFEVEAHTFIDLEMTKEKVYPVILKDILKELATKGVESFQPHLYISRT